MKQKFLVTGAAGFIGSHVSEKLIGRGHEVTGVDNFDPFYSREVKERNLLGLRTLPGFRFVEADVARDPMPLDGVEAVIHLAAKPGVRASVLTAYFSSRQRVSMVVMVFCCHRLSRTSCGLPNLRCAWRRASSGDMPRARFSAISSAI